MLIRFLCPSPSNDKLTAQRSSSRQPLAIAALYVISCVEVLARSADGRGWGSGVALHFFSHLAGDH
jgi:hypothetical protein